MKPCPLHLDPQINRRLEKKIKDSIGKYTSILETKVSVLTCGCMEISFILHGLYESDINAKISDILADLSVEIGIETDYFYASKFPGTENIDRLAARKLCEICKEVVDAEGQISPYSLTIMKYK